MIIRFIRLSIRLRFGLWPSPCSSSSLPAARVAAPAGVSGLTACASSSGRFSLPVCCGRLPRGTSPSSSWCCMLCFASPSVGLQSGVCRSISLMDIRLPSTKSPRVQDAEPPAADGGEGPPATGWPPRHPTCSVGPHGAPGPPTGYEPAEVVEGVSLSCLACLCFGSISTQIRGRPGKIM